MRAYVEHNEADPDEMVFGRKLAQQRKQASCGNTVCGHV